jgi:hypothetical protein
MEVEEEMLVEPTVIEAAAQAAFQDDSEPMDSGDDMATRPSYPALSAAQMAVSGLWMDENLVASLVEPPSDDFKLNHHLSIEPM